MMTVRVRASAAVRVRGVVSAGTGPVGLEKRRSGDVSNPDAVQKAHDPLMHCSMTTHGSHCTDRGVPAITPDRDIRRKSSPPTALRKSSIEVSCITPQNEK